MGLFPPLSPPLVLYRLNLYRSTRIIACPVYIALPFICFHICGFICDYSDGFLNTFSCGRDIKPTTGCNESSLHLMWSLKSAVLCTVLWSLGTTGSFQEGHSSMATEVASAYDPLAEAVQGLCW